MEVCSTCFTCFLHYNKPVFPFTCIVLIMAEENRMNYYNIVRQSIITPETADTKESVLDYPISLPAAIIATYSINY
jgi:hypothetical protein